ncbi:MAG: ATP-binding protein [Nitrososphaerota archaeon]|nr:ATP-binding protein [Aigarchaeota archaeon]MDW8076990.1 ATP-binding protein [Nitrososphaerota archaeon]
MDEVGIVVGEARPERIQFSAKDIVRVGEFVTVDTVDGRVLYLVEFSKLESKLLSKVHDYITTIEAREASKANPRDIVKYCIAKAVGLVEEVLRGARVYPTMPPNPGSPVFLAEDELLKRIFHNDSKEWVEVGRLLRRKNVTVSVNLNKIASRHLAILASTGKGKSNLLALIAKRIAEKNGTMIILDYHAEYHGLKIGKVRFVSPKINPRYLDSEELADMLDIKRDATRQRGVLREAYTKEVMNAPNFWEALKKNLDDKVKDEDEEFQTRATAKRVIEIIERNLAIKGNIFDTEIENPLNLVEPNRINVLDLSGLTETQAQIIVAHYLAEILNDRKNAMFKRSSRFRSPVVIAVEEAHTFIPQDRSSKCSDVLARIAREGRKFGVSLILVSQRPCKLNADVVSQMGSFAISGLTHPKDQQFVMEVTDEVSTELGASLPSLNTGEMILSGQWVTVPVLVKVDLVEEKYMGMDLDAVRLWAEDASAGHRRISTEELIRL